MPPRRVYSRGRTRHRPVVDSQGCPENTGLNRAHRENALFAWLPTITPISRQAAYSGKVPRYFAETLDRTDKDESGWRQFWTDHSLSPAEIAFADVHGNANDLAKD